MNYLYKSEWKKNKEKETTLKRISLLLVIILTFFALNSTNTYSYKAEVDTRDDIQKVTDSIAEAWRLYQIDGNINQYNRSIELFNLYTK